MPALFGPARIRNYQSSFARNPPAAGGMGDIPSLAAPQPKAGQGGYGGGSAVEDMPVELQAPQAKGSRFQQSLDTQRAQDARSAQVFAQNSPLPTNSAGEYSGAYGSGPQAAQQAQAAKSAYVDKQAATSNLNSGNYYVNRNLALDANDRRNNESAAGVDATGAQTAMTDAERQFLVPQMAKGMGAESGLVGSQAAAITGSESRANLLAPQALEGMKLHNQGTAQQNEHYQQFAAPQAKEELEAQRLQNQRTGAMTGPMVQGAYDSAANTAANNKREHQLLQDEMAFNKQKMDNSTAAPAVDVEAQKLEHQSKQLDLYKKAGRDDLIKQMFPAPGVVNNSMGDAGGPARDANFEAGPVGSFIAKGMGGGAAGAPATGAAAGIPRGSGPNGEPTQADLEHTAKMNGLTIEQLKAELAKRGMRI